jgi:hypothetical protein
LHDCSDGKQQLRSPNCGRHPENAESHDQLKWLYFRNKHSDHYRVQKLPAWKVERRDDKEFAQIYLI